MDFGLLGLLCNKLRPVPNATTNTTNNINTVTNNNTNNNSSNTTANTTSSGGGGGSNSSNSIATPSGRSKVKGKENLAIHFRNGDNAKFGGAKDIVLKCAEAFRHRHKVGVYTGVDTCVCRCVSLYVWSVFGLGLFVCACVGRIFGSVYVRVCRCSSCAGG
jgi:hypothetical protein